MKIRVKEEDGFQLSTICRQLKLVATDGKKRATDCANTEGIFRLIQFIPSPKAEPFRRWLAKVGYERVQEKNSKIHLVQPYTAKNSFRFPVFLVKPAC
jgi:hypothetical protein